MAMEVLPANSGGSFLDNTGVFSGGGGRTSVVPPSGFDTSSVRRSPITPTLDFNTTHSHDDDDDDDDDDLQALSTTPLITTPHSLDATPDSGISGLAYGSSTRSKSPDNLDITGCSSMTRSSSTGSGNGIIAGGSSSRKRKTVTIDESQTSVVMISPDDLFNTYSKTYSPSSPSSGGYDPHDTRCHVYHVDDENDDNEDDDDENDNYHKYYWESDPMHSLREEDSSGTYYLDSETGWPLKRSESLESRDNPFLPGGDLCKEAEDLLSKATIIRDNFYLNEEEKRELELHRQAEQQQLEEQQQQKTSSRGGGTKHVQILDHHDGRVYSSSSSADPSSSSPHPLNGGVEERISPMSVSNSFVAPPSTTVPSTDPNHRGANGKSNDHNNTTNNTTSSSSPDSVKIAIPDGEGIPGQAGDSLGADKKRRNKCCVVM